MFNTQKVCGYCGWKRRYDDKRDIHRYSDYIFCPVCKNTLEIKGYSPNL